MTVETDTQGSVTAVYQVSGMSCGHCEGAVSGEITQLAGVSSVKAVASTGEVTVVSAAPSTRRPCAPPSTRRASSWSAGPEAGHGYGRQGHGHDEHHRGSPGKRARP